MTKFATDANLGKVVDMKATKVWCFGVDPLKTMYDLRFAAGGNKFSQLCAFKFKSLNPNSQHQSFSVAFVPKLQSYHYHRKDKNISQWFIFKQISHTQVDVLDKQSCFINYGFDVDKFFDSDMFKLMLQRIETSVRNGLKQVPQFISTLTRPEDVSLAERFAASIEASLPLISVPKVNDKYYQLHVGGLGEDEELDEKIEQELKRKGIYADLNDSDEPLHETAINFDRYDWKDGSITGKGLSDLLSDSRNWNSMTEAVKVYDRASGKYFDIVDANIDLKNSGVLLQIDMTRESNGKKTLAV